MASSFNPGDDEDGAEQAKKSENPGGEVLADDPAHQAKNDAIYVRESHNFTGSDRRTDLRTTDAHASWREVYAALHCPTEW